MEASKSLLHHVGLDNGAAHHFTGCWEDIKTISGTYSAA